MVLHQWVHTCIVSCMGKHASEKQDCSACHGTGEITIGNNGSSSRADCTVCRGSGKV